MKALGRARFVGREVNGLSFEFANGFRARLFILDSGLVRVLVLPPGGLRLRRTWSLAPNGRDVPWTGRDRLDPDGFPCPDFAVEEAEDRIRLSTDELVATVELDEFRVSWSRPGADGAAPAPFATDRPTQSYFFARRSTAIAHYMARSPGARHFGLGDKSGALDRTGRRFRFLNMDALGYDAEIGDPLYKHVPFYLVHDAERDIAYGLFYDNLATAAMDFGCERDNYHGQYRVYAAEDGDLDYYFLFGPRIRDVVARYTALTGGTAFAPKWSLGFACTSMDIFDASDADHRTRTFMDTCRRHDIPCDALHFGSGYTTIGGRRYVFTWNQDKFPEPKETLAALRESGLHVAANLKPCLLNDHPRYRDAEAAGLFIRDSGRGAPVIAQFWDGVGAQLDFTNPDTVDWWQRQVTEQILSQGIGSAWNDNNEYEIWEEDAACAGMGEPFPLSLNRPLQALLMTRASFEAQRAFAPDRRPYVVTRAGCPGTQRYAQSWTGDNLTAWKTLRFNLRQGLSLGLSGMFNIGHDVGGFAGPPPDPELLVRWVQAGAFHPRFLMNSWSEGGKVTLPWMYPDVIDPVRATMRLRYRLMPYLYTLAWRACREHVPILRSTFFEFDGDPETFAPCDEFLLGDQLLVAPVVEPGQRNRELYLPRGPAGWWDIHTGAWQAAGERVSVPAPLDYAPLFARDGAIVPTSDQMAPLVKTPDDRRGLMLFPHREGGESRFTLFEDDGISPAWEDGAFCLIEIVMRCEGGTIEVSAIKDGAFTPGFHGFAITLPSSETRALILNGQPADREADIPYLPLSNA